MKNKGITLIEIMIATGLMGILLSMTGFICVDGIRAFHKSRFRLTTQQEATMATDRLCRELNETHSDTITLIYSVENGGSDNEFDAVSFGTPKDNDEATGNIRTNTATGRFEWERFIVYSKKVGETDVYRSVINKQSPSGINIPSPLSVNIVKNGVNDLLGSGIRTSHRKMARDIYNINFTEQKIGSAVHGIKVKVISRVVAGKDDAGNKTYETAELVTFIRPWK